MPIHTPADDTECPFDYPPAPAPWGSSDDDAQARCIDPTEVADEPATPDTERPDFDWQAAYEAELEAEWA